MSWRGLLAAGLLLAGAVAIIIGGYLFGLPLAQTQRADAKLASANSHIDDANRLMFTIQTDRLGSEAFTSLENINAARDAVVAAQPLLEQAMDEARQASTDARSAASLSYISRGYRDYLRKKVEIADMRVLQLQTLMDSIIRMGELYDAGAVIFTSLEDMDRLLGQFQVAMGKVQTSPAEAGAALRQAAESMQGVAQKLDEAHQQTGFPLLVTLSQSVKDYAELSSAAAQLADAADTGDQAQAQSAAINLERKLLNAGGVRSQLDQWWQEEIEPLQTEYQELQARMESMDTEASLLYESR